MNKFIKKNVDLTSTAKPFSFSNINKIDNDINKVEEEKPIEKVEEPKVEIIEPKQEEAPQIKEIKEEPKVIKEPKEPKKQKKETPGSEQVMTERKTGKQRKADLFTRHTIIVRKDFLHFFQAMSRLNDNISLTDTLDAIFRYVIDNMSEEDVKKVKKKMNERLDIFNTLKLNED